jgi:hypothetical protein
MTICQFAEAGQFGAVKTSQFLAKNDGYLSSIGAWHPQNVLCPLVIKITAQNKENIGEPIDIGDGDWIDGFRITKSDHPPLCTPTDGPRKM